MRYFKILSVCVFCLVSASFANEQVQTSINMEYGTHNLLSFEQASSNYEYVPADYYENVIENVKAGNRLAQIGDNYEAIRYFESAIEYDSTYVFAYNGLANVYINLNNLSKAETLLLSAIKFAQDQAFLYNNLANLYLKQGKKTKALENLRIAIKLNPNSSLINYNLANIYYTSANYSSAIVYFKKALQFDANMCDARFNLALSYREIGLNSMMISEYEELVNRCPGHVKGVLNLAAYYIIGSKNDKALILYRQAIVLNPDPQLYLALGHAYHNKGYFKQEISSYTSAVEVDSSNMQAWKYLATAYYEQDMLVSALNTCQEALKIDSQAEGVLDIFSKVTNK